MSAQTFTVNIPQEKITDLQARLANTRWPDETAGASWNYGTDLAYLKELIDYWRNVFDWRAQEQFINSFANYRVSIDGLDIHFVHERGRGPNPLPIVITHGWPSSFYQMLKLAPLLTDPASHGGDAADSFDVVVPSLPGYGFSERPKQPGVSARVAEMWAHLRPPTF